MPPGVRGSSNEDSAVMASLSNPGDRGEVPRAREHNVAIEHAVRGVIVGLYDDGGMDCNWLAWVYRFVGEDSCTTVLDVVDAGSSRGRARRVLFCHNDLYACCVSPGHPGQYDEHASHAAHATASIGREYVLSHASAMQSL